ncbi:hypothetical protein [Haladaptatus halobius]|uniref:hypothetical protein n=1 Tax=Haladaptatus halobius TaxID=2884875 RepID=UPI003F60C8DC
MERLDHAGTVVGMDVVERNVPHDLVRVVAEALDGRTVIVENARLVDECNEVVRVFDERVQSVFRSFSVGHVSNRSDDRRTTLVVRSSDGELPVARLAVFRLEPGLIDRNGMVAALATRHDISDAVVVVRLQERPDVNAAQFVRVVAGDFAHSPVDELESVVSMDLDDVVAPLHDGAVEFFPLAERVVGAI